jgi:glyoxylase-like metal-dependent hydrolase (beta-lactamase superfamily II)
MTVYALRCAHVDVSVSLADALLPPDGDDALRPARERDRKIRGTHACFFLQMGDIRILIDTGLKSSVLTNALHEANIAPESINLILLTHGDHDHIGGLANAEGTLVFPNARIFMHEELWKAWTSDGQFGDQGAFYADEQRDLVRTLVPQIEARVEPIKGEGILIPRIQHLAAPGHRASHMAFAAETENGRLLFMGDALVFPELFEDLSREGSFDSDPKLAVLTRRKLLELACQENTLCCIPHFPFPGIIDVTGECNVLSWSPWNSSNPPA